MRFPLGTDEYCPEFSKKQAAIPAVDCDLFFALPDVYFVPQAVAGQEPQPEPFPPFGEAVLPGGEKVTVYIDAVFVLNLAVNYLLLRAAATLGGAALRRGRLLLGALIGAVYAVAVYLPHCGWLTGLVWKILCGAAMVLAAFGCKRSTLRLGAVFGEVALILCGAVYGVQFLQSGRLHYRGDALFFPVSFFTLLLTAAAVGLACKLLLPKLTFSADSVVPVTVSRGKSSVRLSALRDTGNTLRDPITGESVLTVYWRSVAPLLDGISLRQEDLAVPAALALRLKHLSPRLIPFRAVGVASGLLLALPCKITINGHTKTGLVALSPTPVSERGAYDALTGGNSYA